MSTTPTIPAETAAHVLAHYGREGGYQAGSFTEHLIKTIDMADPHHRDLLALGFPDYVAAVVAIQYDRDGVIQLQRIAAGEVAAQESPMPQCPEALFTPETGDLRRCVQQGRHDWHRAADGTQWRIPVGSPAEVPF